MALEDLIARIRLDTTDLEAGAGKAAAIGGVIGGAIGGVITAGLSAAASGIKDFISGAVDGFSELEDSTAAAGVVFGDAMGTIIDQSKTAAGSLGLSEQQVINAANTFGTYGKAAGLSGEGLAGFSTQLTTLAGDMASFKGTSTEQAIEAVGAALRGETEPIRAYGVLLDDATLKAEAMAMGIATGTEPLTAQQKVLAAQSAILKQTTDAQGDFARSSDSTANVAATLAANAENLQAKFGTLLAPAFTAARASASEFMGTLSGVLDNVIPKFDAFYERAGAAMTGLKALFLEGDYTSGLGAALGIDESDAIVGVMFGIRDAVITVFDSVRGAVSGIDFGGVFSQLAGGVQAVLPGIMAGLAPIGDAFVALGPTIGQLIPSVLAIASAFNPVGIIIKGLLPILPQLATMFGTLVSTMLGAIQPLIPVILTLVETIAGQLGATMVQLYPVIMQLVTALGGVLMTTIQILAPIIGQLVGFIAQLLPPIIGLIGPLLQLVMSALMPLVQIVGNLISAILPPLLDLFMAILEPVIELVAQIATALAPVLTLVASIIGGVLAPVLSTLIGWLGNVIGWVLRLAGPILGGLTSMLSTVIGWIASVIGSIASWVSNLGGAGAAIGRFKDSVVEKIAAVLQWFRELPGNIGSALGNMGRLLFSAGQDVVRGLMDGIKNMASSAIEAVKDVGRSIISGAKSVLGIASPSKEFRKIGEWTGEGLADGIAASTAGVEAAARDMVGALDQPVPVLTAGYNVPRPGAGSGAGNYGFGTAPTATLVRVYIGDRELTDIVRVETSEVLAEEASAILTGATSA